MAYLAEPTSKTSYGVIKIGNYVDVTDGVISIPQDINTNATVFFDTVRSNVVYDNNNRVVTSVAPTTGSGISVTSLTGTGPNVSFKINNTGVLSLTAGSGISLSSNTGNILISSFGADLINVFGTTGNYTATLLDEYIGVSSASAVTISLPAGVDGRVYTVKDEFGQGSGKITIQSNVGELIDKKTNYIISVPNQSVSLVFRANTWWII